MKLIFATVLLWVTMIGGMFAAPMHTQAALRPVCGNNTTPLPTAFRGDPSVFCADHGGYTEGMSRDFCDDNTTIIPRGTNPDRHCGSSGGYTASTGSGRCRDSFLGLPAWYRYLELGSDPVTGDSCTVVGPSEGDGQLNWPRVVGLVALAIVEALLRIASLVAVGYVVYGGFRYITSQGDPENAKSARQTIINALIGLVIAIASAGIVTFVAGRLTS